ncbi:MAG: transcriptional regulator, MerR family [Conexibacter sp.]|nr:transcriptional regulator, MerR family [Conexibacter sp.]
MDTPGQTISATEFAALTGVSRERLRTWERRFDFPHPTRVGRGPRRYAVADALRVVAVRRAAEEGVPLPRAIEEAGEAPVATVSAQTLAGVVVAAPTPVVLVGGPQPLRCRFANTSVRAQAVGPVPGQPLAALPWFAGSELERSLRTLFATTTPVLECGHPAWTGEGPAQRSIAYRLPVAAGEPPTVAIVGIDRPRDLRARRELSELQAELVRLRQREQRQERSLALAAAIAERFQEEAGEAVIGSTSDTLVRRLGAVDAGIAVYMAGELALGSSSRGLLGPRMVPVTAYADLGRLMHAAEPGWLTAASGRAFGMPTSLHSLAVPITVIGETLGVLLLVFDEPRELDDDARRLLRIVSAGLGFALLRDRLVEAAKSEHGSG